MAKLSKIFENVDHTKSYEKQKREYFAKKIFESFLISEGKSSKGFSIDEVTNKIFLEAIKYGDEKKAIRFVKDIENEFMMNEGFMDTIKGAAKGAANWAKDKVSKVIGKIKDWFAGPIQKAFTAFNAKVKPVAEKLMKEGKKTLVDDTTKTAELAAPETPKLLTQSLTITVPQDYSYLMEGLNLDMSGDAAKGPIDHAVAGAEGDAEGGEATADDGAEADAGVQAMADNLFGGKKIESGKKTGSTQARVKFYAITKSGNNSTLWVGPDPTVNTMKVLGAYMASSGKIFLNLADDIIGSQLEMDLIANLFLAIKNNPKLNPKGEYGAVSNAGKKIIVDHTGKKMQIIPGKLVIAGVGGKAGLPMKLKGASTQEKFMGVLGIKKQEEETGTDTEVVTNNTAKEDGKPKQEDFVDGFGKPDVAAFEAAMKEWADKEDDKDFGTDHNGEEVDYLIDLEAKINQFFGMNHEDLINNKLDDVVDTVFEKTPVVVEDLNKYNDNIGTVLEYYQGTDKKLTPEQATAIAGDLNAIVEVSYPKVIARSLEKVETPEEKQAIVDRGINLANELVKIAASHGVTFTFDKTKWAEKTGGLELKDWTDGTNYGDLTGPDAAAKTRIIEEIKKELGIDATQTINMADKMDIEKLGKLIEPHFDNEEFKAVLKTDLEKNTPIKDINSKIEKGEYPIPAEAAEEEKTTDEDVATAADTDPILDKAYELIFSKAHPEGTPTSYFADGDLEGNKIEKSDASNFLTKLEVFTTDNNDNRKVLFAKFNGSEGKIYPLFTEILKDNEGFPLAKPAAEATDAEVEEANADPKAWMGLIINQTKSKVDGGLLEKLKVDAGSLWKNFAGFADKHNNDLPSILIATDGGGNHSPMSNNEFIAYASTLNEMLGYIGKATGTGKLDTQEYDAKYFGDFIVDVQSAANDLSKVINVNTVKAQDDEPTAGEQATGAVTGAAKQTMKKLKDITKDIIGLPDAKKEEVVQSLETDITKKADVTANKTLTTALPAEDIEAIAALDPKEQAELINNVKSGTIPADAEEPQATDGAENEVEETPEVKAAKVDEFKKLVF